MTDPPRGRTRSPPPGRRAAVAGKVQLSIGDLAKEFDVSTRAIRFYETRGLLRPKRNGLNRAFGPADRQRLALILRARNLGLSLEEIGEHLALHDAGAAPMTELQSLKRQCERHIADLLAKRADLSECLKDLKRISADITRRMADEGRPRG